MISKLTVILAVVAFNCCVESSAHPGFGRIKRMKVIGNQAKQVVEPLDRISDIMYTGSLNIGSPEQQFDMLFDTRSTHFWLVSDKCNSQNCYDRAKYISSKSSTYKADGRPIQLRQRSGTLNGFLSSDDVSIGGIKIKNQTFEEATALAGRYWEGVAYDGLFGLGLGGMSEHNATTPFQNMIEQNLIAEPIFSIFMGYDLMKWPDGEIMFGGINRDFFTGDITYTKVTSSNEWQIKMDGVSMGNEMKVCNEGCQAVVATGTLLIGGPEKEVTKLNEHIGATNFRAGRSRVLRDCNLSELPELVFMIEGKSFGISPKQYVLYDSEESGRFCYSGLVGMNNVDHWTLGDIFITGYYTVFDYGNKRIGFATSIN